jgi:hypothetical protein
MKICLSRCNFPDVGRKVAAMREPTLEWVRLKIQGALGNGLSECDWMPGEHWLDAAVRVLEERHALRAEIAAMNDADEAIRAESANPKNNEDSMNVYELPTFPAGEKPAVSKDRPWFVWSPGVIGGGDPRVGHASWSEANQEAHRLAALHPGRIFAVGNIVGVVACVKPETIPWTQAR